VADFKAYMAHEHRRTQTQNKRTQTSMPLVGFEPTIPVFEQAKTVYVLDRVDTVIGKRNLFFGTKISLELHDRVCFRC
jgi:hypothetical protein